MPCSKCCSPVPNSAHPPLSAGKFKTPFEYVVSAVRGGGVDVTNVRPLLGVMARLGQPLYGCLTPDGYQNTRAAWLNPDALRLRIGFATALGSGHLPLDRAMSADGEDMTAQPQSAALPDPIDSAGLLRLLGPAVSAKTAAAVSDAPPPLKAALILGSPDFMTR